MICLAGFISVVMLAEVLVVVLVASVGWTNGQYEDGYDMIFAFTASYECKLPLFKH